MISHSTTLSGLIPSSILMIKTMLPSWSTSISSSKAEDKAKFTKIEIILEKKWNGSKLCRYYEVTEVIISSTN